MPYMLWGTPPINNSFAYKYLNEYSHIYSQNINSIKSKGQIPTPRVKGELSSSKPKVKKLAIKLKASTDKLGPKAT